MSETTGRRWRNYPRLVSEGIRFGGHARPGVGFVGCEAPLRESVEAASRSSPNISYRSTVSILDYSGVERSWTTVHSCAQKADRRPVLENRSVHARPTKPRANSTSSGTGCTSSSARKTRCSAAKTGEEFSNAVVLEPNGQSRFTLHERERQHSPRSFSGTTRAIRRRRYRVLRRRPIERCASPSRTSIWTGKLRNRDYPIYVYF